MRRLASSFLATLILAAGPLAAQPAPEPARTIAFELREGGRLVAAPSITVQMGRPAAVSVGEYSLRLRVTRATAGQGPYLVRSSLYRSDSGWTLVATPAVTVPEGEQAHLRFAGTDGSDLSLAVRVR
ncbi:hypothetical protein [Sphingosinicella sp. CPCC 101087]|uniref:hypothetical protein n=1 Tax=Sphingosinicella sp. CPCC 101087 TaxID=2497754 RepID=UPI00101B9B93|nr:hypothetical protein [Sphingosinicella sp. CPCC 101087]